MALADVVLTTEPGGDLTARTDSAGCDGDDNMSLLQQPSLSRPAVVPAISINTGDESVRDVLVSESEHCSPRTLRSRSSWRSACDGFAGNKLALSLVLVLLLFPTLFLVVRFRLIGGVTGATSAANSEDQKQQLYPAMVLPWVKPAMVTHHFDVDVPDIKTFVINRDVDHDRMNSFRAYAKEADIPFERISAVDKNSLTYVKLQQMVQDNEISQHIADFVNTHSKYAGKYACTLSHVRLWQRLVREPDRTKPFLIFEDDSIIPRSFTHQLHAALRTVPTPWDMLYLNHNTLVGTNVVGPDGMVWLKPASEWPGKMRNGLANAYMVNPAGLRRILSFMSPISYPYSNDDNLRHHFRDFKAYFLIENLAPQSGAPSVRLSPARIHRLPKMQTESAFFAQRGQRARRSRQGKGRISREWAASPGTAPAPTPTPDMLVFYGDTPTPLPTLSGYAQPGASVVAFSPV